MADEKKENMIKAAEKLLKQGRIQQALTQYEKILSRSPDDPYVLNRIGDLHAKFGKIDEAKNYFRKIAIHYEMMGFEPQAMAIWKKIIKMDPMEAEASFKLAELFQNRNLMIEAKRYYLTSAESFMNNENYENARKAYEQLLLLEPDNMKLREKIGEVLITAGKDKEGAGEYLKIAADLEEQGFIEKAMKYHRKAITLDPSSLKAAESFLDRMSLDEMKEKAIFFAEDLFFNMPDRGQAASILANLFIKLKRYSDASKILEKAIKSDCNEKHHVKKSFGRLSMEEGNVDNSLEWFEKAAQDLVEAGEYTDARDILKEFVDTIPDHLRGLQRLLEMNKKLEDKEGVAFCYQRLEEICKEKGMPDDASMMKEKCEAMAEDTTISDSREARSRRQEASVETMIEDKSLVKDEELVGLLKKSEYIEKQITIAEVYKKYQLYDQVVHHLDDIIKKVPEDNDVREKLIEVLGKVGEKERMTKEALTLASLYERRHEEQKAVAVLQKTLKMSPENQDLQRNLVLLKQGKPMEPVQEYERKETVEVVPQEKSEESFEIEIDEESDDDEKYESISRSLDVLKEKIKEEIASDDYKSHYDLGIAYKEMGLIDEAIKEFDLARGSDDFYVTSSLLMGLCHRLKGDLISAEKMIDEGLKKAQNEEQRLEFWYELADIFFQQGKLQKCYDLLNQILKINADYRNTSIKANKLLEMLEEE